MQCVLPRNAVLACAVAIAALLASGCAAKPDTVGAAATAASFYDAIASDDGAGACALLAPTVVETLEDDAGEACSDAVLADDVGQELTAHSAEPDAPEGATARAYGTQAQVRLHDDVVFLAVSGTGWRVTAAGCTPRLNRPYDCVLEGS